MSSWNEDVRALKEALENLDTLKSTSTILTGICRNILKILNLSQTQTLNF